MQKRVLAKAGSVRGPQFALLSERLLSVLNKGLRLKSALALVPEIAFLLEQIHQQVEQ